MPERWATWWTGSTATSKRRTLPSSRKPSLPSKRGDWGEVKGFCAVADLETIAKQDYILTPGCYVGIEEQERDAEPFDEKMKRLTGKLSGLFAKSHELEDKIRRDLGAIGYGM